MKKSFKKFGVIVLALAMVFALTAVAFAADTTGDVYTDDSKTPVSGNEITFNKAIVLFNANGSSVYEPNITFTYTVAPVKDASLLGTIKDDGEYNENVPVTVKANAGVDGGVIFASGDGSISFSSNHDPVDALATGTEVEYSTKLTVVPTAFPHAGVYRYKITEGTIDVTTVGMDARTADEYSAERYLDVYIKNGDSSLELSGAVIFKTNAVDSSNKPGTEGITITTEKTTGFEPGKPGSESGTVDYTNDKTVDRYTTYDFTVKKVITGSMADKTNDFPFYVNVTNSIAGAAYTYFDDPGTGTGAKETVATGATIAKGTDSKDSDLKLKDGEYVKFVGVPSNQTNALSVMIKEYNNTFDQYTATVADKAGTALTTNPADGIMAPNDGTAALAAAYDLKTNDVAAQVITVTNTMSQISETGVVMRVAPFAAMGAAGIVFLAVSKKSKKEEEEA